jgi:murein DD-endopeptidase MepM/ murein hydrolase activator NlpD
VITSALAPIVDSHKIAAGLPPTYVVQKGDTVRVIANAYKVTVAALAQNNPGLNIDRIEIGEVLHIPSAPVWLCPVNGPHSWRDDWGAFRSDTGFHEGNDVLAARGTPVVAPVGGTLQLKQGTIGGNAFYLRGDDGNTYYGAHLDRYVRDSGRIEAGIQIGVVGDTGDAKGGATHLHFEFHPNNGAAVDPYFTLKAWC